MTAAEMTAEDVFMEQSSRETATLPTERGVGGRYRINDDDAGPDMFKFVALVIAR